MGRKEIQALKDKIETMKQDMTEQAQSMFHEEVKAIFAAYPDMQSFSWTQYTPYFNDGDTCEFSCQGSDSISINQRGPNPEDDEDFEADDGGEYISYSGSEKPKKDAPWMDRACYDICSLIALLGDDVMYDLFGDHSEVIVGREKIVIEEYEHE